MNYQDILFSIIRREALKIECNDAPLPEFDYERLYHLSGMHHLSHIVSSFVKNNNIPLPDELSTKFDVKKNNAVFGSIKQDNVREIIFKIFNEASIEFIPLKGSVTKNLYPEPWMRISSDIDILVHEEDFDKAVSLLAANGFKISGDRDYHDISLYLDGVHLELHYNVCENLEKPDAVLKQIWENSEKVGGSLFKETDTFFVFHHIAHMCYHFIFGGCGLIPFIDLYLFEKKLDVNKEKLEKMLEEAGIKQFYEKVLLLCEVWFENKKRPEDITDFENYIIRNSEYTTKESRGVMLSAYNKSKASSAASIIFPDYEFMSNLYPNLKKHKILLPFYYIKRIFSKLTQKRQSVVKRMQRIASQSDADIEKAANLLKYVGLE